MTTKTKKMLKRISAFVIAVVMVLLLIIPNNFFVAKAAGTQGYSVSIQLLDYDKSTISNPEGDVNSTQYFVMAIAKGGMFGQTWTTYAIKSFWGVQGGQVQVNFDKKDFRIDTQYGNDYNNGNGHYDTSNTYNMSEIKIFKMPPNTWYFNTEGIHEDDIYNGLVELETFEGYSLLDSSMNNDSATLKFYKSEYPKTYEIRIEAEPTMPVITAADKYYYFVDVTKKKGGHMYYMDSIVIDGSGDFVKVPINEWRDNNGNVNSNFKLEEQDAISVNILKADATMNSFNYNNAISRTGCSVVDAVKGYEVQIIENDLVRDDVNYVDALSHTIRLGKIIPSSDYTYLTVLGNAVRYGVVSNTVKQHGHSETNLAVNKYNPNSNNLDSDLSSDANGNAAPGNYLMGELEGEFRIGQNTPATTIIFTPENNFSKIKDDTGKYAVKAAMPLATVNEKVNAMIAYTSAVANDMITKPATIKPVVINQHLYIDTTDLPEDATIYVDADAYVQYIAADSGVHINKKKDQLIVFNFKNQHDSLTIGKTIVDWGKGEKDTFTKTGERESDQNSYADLIAQQLVWNLKNVKQTRTSTAGGVFIQPTADSTIRLGATSCGWAVSAGHIDLGTEGEFHFVYHGVEANNVANIQLRKFVDDASATSAQVFEFKVERLTDKGFVDVVVKDGDGNVKKYVNEESTITIPVTDLDEGNNIYKITEVGKLSTTAGKYETNTQVFYAQFEAIYVTSGNATIKVPSTIKYYTEFSNGQVSSEINASQAIFKNITKETSEEPETKTADVLLSKKALSKVGDELKGAKITLTGKATDNTVITFDKDKVVAGNDATVLSDGNSLVFISGSTATLVKELVDGTYTMHEESAPVGYVVATDITFTVQDGEVVAIGNAAVTAKSDSSEAIVVMVDDAKKAEVFLSKKAVSNGGSELKGAKITLTGKDAEGLTIAFDRKNAVAGVGATIIADGGSLVYASGTTPTLVKNLCDGTYVMHEEIAPEGYNVATDIVFVVKNGEVVAEGNVAVTASTDSKAAVVVMVDGAKPDVLLSKKAVDKNGSELAGATITLTGKDSDGKTITFDKKNVVAGQGATVVSDGTSLVYKSGSTETLIKSLSNGTYTMHEDAAPEGYNVATDITFVVEDGKVVATGNAAVTAKSTSKAAVVTMVDGAKPDVYLSKKALSKAGNELKNATIALTGKSADGATITFDKKNVVLGTDAKFVSEGNSLVYISGTTPTMIKNLADGTYTMHEEVAPEGYNVATDITFVVKNGEVVASGNAAVSAKTDSSAAFVTMVDAAKPDVILSKKAAFKNGKELAGATITLSGKDVAGNTVIFKETNIVLGLGASLKSTGNSLVYVSGSSSTLVKALPDGTYTMHEDAAPKGYLVATEIKFVVKDGEIVATANNAIIAKTLTSAAIVVMIDDAKTADVIFSKKAIDKAGDELAGATIILTGKDEDDNVIIFDKKNVVKAADATIISDGESLVYVSGSIPTLVKKLPNGTYTMHEEVAPEGYKVATDIKFVIKDGDIVAAGNLAVTAQSDNSEAIVTMVDAAKQTETESQSETQTQSQSQPQSETQTQSQSQPQSETQTQSQSQSQSQTPSSDPDKANVSLSKKALSKAGEELKGATITLTGKTASNATITFDKKNVVAGKDAVIVSDGNSLVYKSGSTSTLVKNLPDGTYTMHENAAPNGYLVATDIKFVVKNGEVVATGNPAVTAKTSTSEAIVVMVDEAKKSEVYLSKKALSKAGEELAGAKITLAGKDANGNIIAFDKKNVVTGTGATIISDGSSLVYVSGSTPTLVKNLPSGTYAMHEEVAPEGYNVATDITFVVELGEVVATDNAAVTAKTTSKAAMVTMVDGAKPDVLLSKKALSKVGEELKNATITLTGKTANGSTITFDKKNVVLGSSASLVSDGESLVYISGTTPTLIKKLSDGIYTMHEDVAPNGYNVATDITFEVKKGEIVATGNPAVTAKTDSSVAIVTMVDAAKPDVILSKKAVTKDGGELKGATITLTGKDTNGNTVTFDSSNIVLGVGAILKSTGNSLVYVSGSTSTLVKGLADGIYTMRENAAPKGYLVATEIKFVVKDGEIVATANNAIVAKTLTSAAIVVMIDDTKKAEVYLSKKALSAIGEELKGATITLTGKTADDKAIIFDKKNVVAGTEATIISDGSELVYVSGTTPTLVKNLPNGTYTMSETVVPEGYEVATDITFVVEDGEVVATGNPSVVDKTDSSAAVVVMVDAAKSQELFPVKISKVEITGGPEIVGATLKLTNKLTDVEVDTWVSGNAVKEFMLLPGIYVLTEMLVPDEYHLQAESIEFTVNVDGKINVKGDDNNGKNSTVVMIDDAAGILEIVVVEDSSTDGSTTDGKIVPGAEIEITTINTDGSKTTKTYVTDDDGKVRITNLPPSDDYSYTVVKIPEGYSLSTIGSETSVVVEKLKVTEKLEKIVTSSSSTTDTTGDLIIAIIDQDTSKTVPGMKVSIEYPDGETTIETSSSTGLIELTGIATGTYKITAIETIDGYKLTTNETSTVTVTGGETTKITHKITTSQVVPGGSVPTGDSSNIALALIAMVAGMLGILASILTKKSKEQF